jgi:hypothetical protein
MSAPGYVRFQSPNPDRMGRRIGIFGLVNMLGRRGLLTTEEEQFRRTTNARYDSICLNPMSVDPTVMTRPSTPRPLPGSLLLPSTSWNRSRHT